MSRRMVGFVLWALALCLMVNATPAAAQKFSLSPNIGVYIPTSELIKAANGQEFKQEIALAVGGVVTSVSYGAEQPSLQLQPE